MSRGRLRIYLGAAPGVGKTFAMLDEGWRRKERGTDVIVGYVETHGRLKTAAQVRDLDVVPRRLIDYRGARLEEMDLDAILARHPKVVLVDELAHTNAPGSLHTKRFEDVDVLLEAGIDVISTVNIQHLESVNDVVERITGVKQRETIPDAVVREADQIELVDMSPEALRRRMAHGNIYAPEKVDAALGNYFRVGNLSALRELALMWVADQVDEGLQQYRIDHGIDRQWETRERVVVALTGSPSGEQLIRRAARMAQRSRAELLGVHIRPSDGLTQAPSDLLEQHRRLLADLGGEYHEVVGTDIGKTLVQFAQAENATQLVLGASRRSRIAEIMRGSVINQVIRESGAIDVHVIRQVDDGPPPPTSLAVRRTPPHLSRRRQAAGGILTLVGIPLLTIALSLAGDTLNLPAQMLLFLLLVVVVAAVGGIFPAVVAALAASAAVNWYFTPPVHTFTIGEVENVVAFVVFLAVAMVVSTLVSQVSRRSADAVRARAEAEALARVAGGMVGEVDPLGGLLSHLRTTFGLEAVAVLRPEGAGWFVEGAAGSPVPLSPGDHETVDLGGGVLLALVGARLGVDDRRVLQAFGNQLTSALEQRALRAEAAEAEALAEADELRTAILRAVSHDLRTPLASIKASVTSMLLHDVEWSDEAREEFLETIDEETDRLNLLVGNLLDMSRIETGTVQVMLRPVGLEEIVPQALASISGDTTRVKVEVPETLPRVMADPALLERAVANVVTNSLRFSLPDQVVRIEGAEVGDRIDLRIVDQGPGVPVDERQRIFEPFQRLGDRGTDGVGLGLAVSRGFVDAMNGELVIDDTPGGGLTTVISLRPAP